MTLLETREVDSPIGSLGVGAVDGALVAVTFEGLGPLRAWAARALGPVEERPGTDPAGAARALEAFFSGELEALARVPVRLVGTPFQRTVWEALREIRPGETWSYRRLAARVGDPAATRAVGAANGRNPVPLVLPCHRVIGSDGSLTGFGGGLPRKRWLLAHEGALPRELGL